MSINPQHVEDIVSGNKKYEYRKQLCKRVPDRIIIYSTYPIMKIIGEVEVLGILHDTPSTIWKKTSMFSGIDKKFFDLYYSGRKLAVAYKLGKVKVYNKPKELADFGCSYAPQSYVYIN